MGLECLASENIVNGEKCGETEISIVDGASFYNISKKKFRQFSGDSTDRTKPIPKGVSAVIISYQEHKNNVAYDVRFC